MSDRRRYEQRRPHVPRHEREGFHADRAAALAVVLAVLLVFVAAASSHAAMLHPTVASSHAAVLHPTVASSHAAVLHPASASSQAAVRHHAVLHATMLHAVAGAR